MHLEFKKGLLSQFSGIFAQPRQQCYAMATTAIMYGTSVGVDFENFDVDQVLRNGDAYYRQCLTQLRLRHPGYEQLCSDDLLPEIRVNEMTAFRVNVSSDVSGYVDRMYNTGEVRMATNTALLQAFRACSHGGFTFTTQGKTLGVWQKSGFFYLFDSHKVDDGHYIDELNGSAFLYRVTEIEHLGLLICRAYSPLVQGPLQMVHLTGEKVTSHFPTPSAYVGTTLQADDTQSPAPKRRFFVPKKKSKAAKVKEIRLNESLEERDERLLRESKHMAFVRANELDSEKEKRLEGAKLSIKKMRITESQAERAERLEKVRLAARNRRAQETQAEKAERLEMARLADRNRRAQETQAEKAERLEMDRLAVMNRRAQETQAKKAERLEKVRLADRNRRAHESQAEKAERLIKDRSRKGAVRTSLRCSETENEREVRLLRENLQNKTNRSVRFHKSMGEMGSNVVERDKDKEVDSDQLSQLFIDFQSNFDWNLCIKCMERFPGVKSNSLVCVRCNKVKVGKNNEFSGENNMDPGEVPLELLDMSMVEEQLIAMVHPVISVYRIRGQQLGYSGQVINFPQEVSDIAKTLPWPVSSLSSVLIVRREQATGYVDFRVRRDKVQTALNFLINNNKWYKDICIDETSLNDLPVDGCALDLVPQTVEGITGNDDNEYQDEVVTTDMPNILLGDQARQIESALDDTIDWPKIGTEPVNEFSTVGYIAMAFPTLFPLGKADLREPRLVKISPSDYFQHMIKYKDGRFAKHPRFRFFAMNSCLRWFALQNGKICVQKNSELKDLNAAGVREKLSKNPGLIKNILCFNSALRGTSAYWHARCGELLDLVQESGAPTLFFTLSAADIHWPDISRLLAPEVDFTKLGRAEGNKIRNNLVNENPVIVAWYFVNRADFFIKSVLVPKFNVRQYWYRVEYQHRGSPHIHGVFWLTDAPDVSKLDSLDDESRDNIACYFDNLITTMHPGTRPIPPIHPCQVRYSEVTNHEDDYCNLISCVQMHTKHGAQCLRVNKKTKVEECRFKFPFPPVDRTHLTKENGTWELRTKRNNPLVNRHHRFVTENWRANCDVQPILSNEAVLNYIAKYASKAEPRSKTLENLIAEALKKDDDTAQSVIQKLFVKMIAERDYSAQETAQILMGWPLYHCSRSFLTINVDEKQWVKISENNTNLPLETYPTRPTEHENVSLFEHVGKYYKRGEKWVTRRTPSVVRVFPKRRKEQGEVYFRQQVLLHIPWRCIDDLLKQGTWEQLYFLRIAVSAPVDLILPHVEDEYESADEDDDERIEDEWMLAARMGPNGDLGGEIEMGMREIDKEYPWGDAFELFSDPLNLPGFVLNEKAKEICEREEIWEDPGVTFSDEQMQVLLYLDERISAIRNDFGTVTANTGPSPSNNMMIIQGKAGSGKSTVIKAMCARLSRELGPNSFKLMAPTGAAAVNVGGSTIHSALHLGVEKQYRKMADENLARFQEEMDKCHFIIIDEMSMVGCSLLKKIDLRCREAKPNFSNSPFGGMTLFLLGDIKQLPPVLDRPVYGTGFSGMLADQGQLLFKSITLCVILSASYRQGGGDQAIFREILDRLSMGKSTKDDWEMLMERERSRLSRAEISLFNNCMRLFPENRSVSSYNFDRLKSLNKPTAKISAEHNNKQAAQTCSDQQAQGLEKTLYLSIGSRIMLRTNLWVAHGLVNGSLGTVTNLVYSPGCSPPNDRPLVVMVEFDNYTGPTVDGSVPISAVTRTWRSGEVNCSRTQFPIILSWAVTIHKSQGLTLPKVVVDIGAKELAAGCSYVALSRSRRLADVVLEPFNLDRLLKIGQMKLLQLRVEEENRLKNLQISRKDK